MKDTLFDFDYNWFSLDKPHLDLLSDL